MGDKGIRKEDFVLRWQRRMVRKNAYGVYFIFKSMEVGPTFRISVPKYPAKDPNYRIIANQRGRFTHYYFYIRDEVLGPIVMRVGSFFPFRATYYLNGHSFIEHQLKVANIAFRKDDNAFLAVDDVAALQAAADKLSPEIIRKRLDYWTFLLGPKFLRQGAQASQTIEQDHAIRSACFRGNQGAPILICLARAPASEFEARHRLNLRSVLSAFSPTEQGCRRARGCTRRGLETSACA